MTAQPPWSDQPITSTAQDCFSRSDYARRVADVIATSRSENTSVVFGLTGPWGSGKTSLIEMVLECLRDARPQWGVARFTPWSSADVSGLLAEFYASLTAALPTDHGEAVRKSFATLLQFAAPAARLIPLAGEAASDVMEKSGQALARSAPWNEAFQDATRKLRSTGVPLLIVADDIDRLQADELVALLKVVRLLGRFPGVQYLLAYDDHTLTRTLSTAWGADDGGATARSFMEKIVQHPLVVPPLLDHQLLERFGEGVDQVLRESGRPSIESGRLGEVVDILPALLPTPRAVDRLLAQLRHYLVLLHPEEINDEDVVLLALVRTAFPRLYDALPRWKSRLIQGHSGVLDHSASSLRYAPVRWEELWQTETAPDSARDRAERLLAQLFPKAFPEDTSTADSGERRICDDRYFDRYIAMTILKDDVSDTQVRDALDEARESRGEALVGLITAGTGSQTALAIGKARTLGTIGTSEERLVVVSVLSGMVDRLDDSRHVFESNRDRAISWMADIISPLDRDVRAADVVDALSGAPFVERLRVWERVVDRVRADGVQRSWVEEVSRVMGDAAVDRLVEHLHKRDEASTDEPPAYYVHVAVKCGRGDRLRERVEKAMNGSVVVLEDLAARMVSTRWLMGVETPPQLGDVNQELWAAVAPDVDDSWYLLPREESVDRDDLSWANRGRLARGRFHRPRRGDDEHGDDVSPTG